MRIVSPILLALALVSPLAAQTLQHDRLTGTSWDCNVDGKALGTITFSQGNIATLSWQGDSEWKSISNGIEIFGVALAYADQTFSGTSSTGKGVTLTLASQPAAAATAPEAAPEPAAEVPIEKLQTIKLIGGQDHRFTIRGQKTAFGRRTNRHWETSWGSYSEEIQRSATYQFTVSHLGSEETALFEILFLGKTLQGDRYPYAFESRRMSVEGESAFDFDIFLKSSESLYRALNIRIRDGSKPDSWVAWMRKGDQIMGLAAGRGSLEDHFESKPHELLALAKQVLAEQ